ncbi:hypothetical protein DFJ77DRAFT_458438 [Powellomyces hirtus]|nr:hypothetical protein DFJ77DRAFT_458438 [Powellomyces hirtus]
MMPMMPLPQQQWGYNTMTPGTTTHPQFGGYGSFPAIQDPDPFATYTTLPGTSADAMSMSMPMPMPMQIHNPHLPQTGFSFLDTLNLQTDFNMLTDHILDNVLPTSTSPNGTMPGVDTLHLSTAAMHAAAAAPPGKSRAKKSKRKASIDPLLPADQLDGDGAQTKKKRASKRADGESAADGAKARRKSRTKSLSKLDQPVTPTVQGPEPSDSLAPSSIQPATDVTTTAITSEHPKPPPMSSTGPAESLPAVALPADTTTNGVPPPTSTSSTTMPMEQTQQQQQQIADVKLDTLPPYQPTTMDHSPASHASVATISPPLLPQSAFTYAFGNAPVAAEGGATATTTTTTSTPFSIPNPANTIHTSTMPPTTSIFPTDNQFSSTTTTTKMALPRLAKPPPQPTHFIAAQIIKHQRKVAHNAIERRYRNNINDRITELRLVVPALNGPKIRDAKGSKRNRADDVESSSEDDAEAELIDGVPAAKKLNKATILKKSTEYILYLKASNQHVVDENRMLRGMLESMGGGEILRKFDLQQQQRHQMQLQQDPQQLQQDQQQQMNFHFAQQQQLQQQQQQQELLFQHQHQQQQSHEDRIPNSSESSNSGSPSPEPASPRDPDPAQSMRMMVLCTMCVGMLWAPSPFSDVAHHVHGATKVFNTPASPANQHLSAFAAALPLVYALAKLVFLIIVLARLTTWVGRRKTNTATTATTRIAQAVNEAQKTLTVAYDERWRQLCTLDHRTRAVTWWDVLTQAGTYMCAPLWWIGRDRIWNQEVGLVALGTLEADLRGENKHSTPALRLFLALKSLTLLHHSPPHRPRAQRLAALATHLAAQHPTLPRLLHGVLARHARGVLVPTSSSPADMAAVLGDGAWTRASNPLAAFEHAVGERRVQSVVLTSEVVGSVSRVRNGPGVLGTVVGAAGSGPHGAAWVVMALYSDSNSNANATRVLATLVRENRITGVVALALLVYAAATTTTTTTSTHTPTRTTTSPHPSFARLAGALATTLEKQPTPTTTTLLTAATEFLALAWAVQGLNLTTNNNGPEHDDPTTLDAAQPRLRCAHRMRTLLKHLVKDTDVPTAKTFVAVYRRVVGVH